MAKQHSPRFLAIVEAARSEIGECSAEELPELIEAGAVVIDVRENHEFEAGHLTDAIHIGKGVIERDIEKSGFEDSQKIILYCGGGFRSAIEQNLCKIWVTLMSCHCGAVGEAS